MLNRKFNEQSVIYDWKWHKRRIEKGNEKEPWRAESRRKNVYPVLPRIQPGKQRQFLRRKMCIESNKSS